MELPTINTYGKYSSDNYGVHCLSVDVSDLTIWFSYKTPIAFQVIGRARIVRNNEWGPTTGKHLNAIDNGDKKNRVSSEEFQRLWDEMVNPLLGQ
jgi:hypothetical protein